MSFLRGFSIAMGANVIVFVLSFLTNKLLYLYLSREDNGSYFLVTRYALLTASVFGGWLRLTFVNIAGNNKTTTPRLAANNVWYSLFILLLLVVVVPVAYAMDLTDLMLPPPFIIIPAIAAGVLFLARNGFQSLLMVNNWMYHYGVSFIVWSVLMIVLNFICIVVLGMGVQAVFMIFIFSTLISTLWAGFGVFQSGGFTLVPSASLMKGSLVMGIRSELAIVGLYLMVYIHPFVLERYNSLAGESMAAIGLFSVCFRVFELFQRGADTTSTVLHANVARQEREAGFRTTMKVCRNLMAGMTLLAVGAALFGRQLIYIIADYDYMEAYPALLIMLPGIVMVTVGSAINSSYWARDYPYKVILAPFAGTAVGLIMNILLVPKYGDMSAAISFTVVLSIWFVYIISVFKHDSGYRYREILIPDAEDIRYLYGRIRTKLLRQPS